tara:strand:+ start:1620 stop:2867 length:1248 start_codon:yes stop_codon:yes gene_type:complete
MKILLEAPILTQSGYGEHSRLVFRALSQKNVEIYVNPLGWGQTGWITAFDKERKMIEKSINNFYNISQIAKAGGSVEFDMQIHVGIPNEFQKKAPYSICVTAGIETDRVSSNWIIKTNGEINKLIVPSEHSKQSFARTSYEKIDSKGKSKGILECGCPIEVVPYPVKNIQPEHLNFSLDTEFNFLSVALLGHRKNIDNTIRWFIEEFKDDNVGLIIKTGSSTGSIMDRNYTRKILQSMVPEDANRKCKVYFLHGDLTESQIHSLYVREDIHAYVTTTHGEGFGLPLFEAAYSGLPVIATDWSGHLDFLEASIREKKKTKQKKLFANVEYELKEIHPSVVWEDILIEGSQWAYPVEESFKKQLRNVYNNIDLYKNRSKTLKNIIQKNFSKENIYQKMQDAIFSKHQDKEEDEILVL